MMVSGLDDVVKCYLWWRSIRSLDFSEEAAPSSSADFLHVFSIDLLTEIFGHLHGKNLLAAASTCKLLRHAFSAAVTAARQHVRSTLLFCEKLNFARQLMNPDEARARGIRNAQRVLVQKDRRRIPGEGGVPWGREGGVPWVRVGSHGGVRVGSHG